MKNVLLIILVIGQSLLFGSNNKKTSAEICLCPLTKNNLKIIFNYNRINDTIDVFNIKEKELGSGENLGSIGDSSGYDLSLGYGITDFIALYYKYQYIGIHYADTKIKNKQHDIYTKINLYHNPTKLFKTFAIDLGFIYNSANDLDIKSTSTLNSMIQKIRPGTSIDFRDDGGTYYKGAILYVIGNDGLLEPFIRIADMSDTSYYIRALTGLEFKDNILHIYVGYKKTSIDSYITLKPDSNIIQNVLDEFGEISLKRDEKSIFAGLNYAYEYQDYIFEGGYEYLKIFGRDANLEEIDDNHIFNGSISKSITNELRVFIGAKAMLHQFNSVIPYLYNEYTKHSYDKKYGYAKIGFIYNLDFN